MYLRKLVKAGPSSHTIALPKEWTRKHHLKKGDLVYLHNFSDKELLLSPHEQNDEPRMLKEKLIEIDDKSLDTIQREITAAYLNNYSLITLSGTSVPHKAKAIRDIVHHFVALEITEQHATKIAAKDYLNLQEISVDKTIKRMDMMIRTMFEDLLANTPALHDNFALRDEDINRLYFLLVRLLKSALLEQNTAQKLALQKTDILLYWQLVHDLENIADHIKQASDILTTNQKVRTKDLIALYTKTHHAYLDAMKAHYQNDKSTAETVAQQRITFSENATTLLSGHPNQHLVSLVENANAINTHVLNLARQVIDKD